MKSFNKKRVSILTLFTLIVQLFLPYFTDSVFAQDPSGLSVTIKEVITGTEPFNTTNQAGPGFYPGDDYSKDDNYVRTLDTIAYTIDYGINPAGSVAKNATLTATLSADASGKPIAVWDSNLVNLYVGVTISDDGRTLTYNIGDKVGGTAYSFSPTAKVLGTAKNGEKFNMDVTFSADNTPSISTNTVDIGKEITVSAFPKLDLAIDCYRTETVLGPSGELGVLLSSTIEILIKNGKGSENIQEDLNFDVDLSKFRELGLHPRLYNFSSKKAVAESGAWGGVESSYSAPYGKGGGEKRVTNSGNFTAIQSATGEDVKITISGADLSGNHTPSKYPNGDIISLEDKYVVSGYLALWIPADEIPTGETEVEVSYKNFDPESTSGQSNFGDGIEPLENNTDTRKIRKPQVNAELSIDEYYVDEQGNELPAEDDIWDRNGVLVAGAEFATVMRIYNRGFVPITDTIVVNKFDPKLVELVEKSSGIAYSIQSSSNINKEDIIVEYGTGEYSDWQEQRSSVDSTDGWYENINDVPGPISKIRIRMKDGKNIPPKSDMSLKIYMKTKDKRIGTIIPNFLSYKATELNKGQWRHSSYDPQNDTGYSYRSDRVTITGAEARIEVTSDKDTVKAGDDVKYTIKSTLTADPPGTYGTAQNVEIINILPKDLIYVQNSAKRGSSYLEPEITENPDGTTTLKWSLGDQLINEVVEDITFDAKISMDVKDLTILNDKVIINTPTDISREAVRTSQKTVTVTNDTAWGVYKTVDEEFVEMEEDLEYTLKYFQLTDKTLNDFEFIDILPYSEDGRSPNTSFKGSYSLKSISGSHGETFLVTNADPRSINKDPNILGGVNWVSVGSIPNDSVTAVKISVADFPKNQPTREIKLILEPTGNKGGDIYTNNFTGRVSDILAMVESNDVRITVVSSSVEGLVWKDLNGNGQIDSGEEGFPNVKVKILDNSENIIEAKTTDENGKYTFENLKSGNYKVQIEDDCLNDYKQTYEYDGSLDQVVTINLNKNQKLTDVNFGYKYNRGEVEARYLEQGTETELAGKFGSIGKVGESYTTQKKEIEGYNFVNVDGSESGKYVEGKTIVTYYYAKKTGDLEVRYLEKGTDKELSTKEESTKTVGEDYTTDKKEIADYDFVEVVGSESGKYVEEKTIVTYYYEKKSGEVEARYLEQGTETELAGNAGSIGKVGESYTTQKKEIEGYKFVEVVGNENGEYVEEKTIVTYYYEKKSGEVEARYLEQGTETELAGNAGSIGKVGESYTTQKKEIEGYKFVEVVGNENGEYVEEKTIVTYYYAKKTGDLEVRYLEKGTDKELSTKEESTKAVGEDYTTDKKEIADYDFVEVVGSESGKYVEGKTTVTYYYEKKSGEVEARYLEQGTETELAGNAGSIGKVGESYTTQKKEIEGYKFVEVVGNENGEYVEGKTIVTYYYAKKTGNLEVRYLEKGTDKELLSSEESTKAVGEDYTTDKKEIANYDFVEVVGSESGKYVEGKTVVTYYYKKVEEKTGDLEVRYLEEGTDKELSTKEESTKAVGESYTTEKKEVEGYKFVNVDGVESGQYIEGKTIVTYYYEKEDEVIPEVKKGRVVVIHKWGEKVLKLEDLGEKEVGIEYTTNSLSEEYKDFKVIVPGNKDGKYEEGTIEVIYYYINTNPNPPDIEEKKIGEVIVKYLEKNTDKKLVEEDLLKDEVGNDYTTTEKKIDGYKLIEKPSNEQGQYIEGTIEVIYYYEKEIEQPIEPEKKIGQVIIKYLEKNTNKELAEENLLKDEVGKDYTTAEKQIDGYKLVENPSNAQGQYIEGTIEVIYYYEKEIPKKNKKRKPKEENVEVPNEEVEIPDEEVPQGNPEVEVEIPDEEVPQGNPEVEVEIPDEEVPQGNPEVEVEIPDEEVPQGKMKVLPKTGEKVPYSNYLMGTLIMILGGTLILRRRKNS